MLISVHIPKTGGGSFKSILSKQFGDRLFQDSGDRPLMHNSETRNNAALISRLHAQDLPKNYDCIHGHFLPTKFDIPAQKNVFVTWFRCPYQRMISRYHFGIRAGLADTKGMSIHEFCRTGRIHNTYAKFLWNFELERFRFIGLTEDYENSISIFRKQFGFRIKKHNNKHVNPNKPIGRKYEISADLKSLIYKNNLIDFEIYEKAIEINEMLKRNYLD